jgi:hypothetical protein
VPVFLKLKKKLYFLLHLTFKETKMIWKNYIDELMATGDLSHAGIYGLDGAHWGSSEQLPV